MALPSIVSSQWFLTKLNTELTEQLDRDIVISGPVNLQLGMRPQLTVQNVQLKNPSWAKSPYAASIGAMDVSAPVWENTKGQFQIDHVSARDVVLHIERGENGTSNWTFGSTKKQQGALQKKAETDNKQFTLTAPRVAKLSLENVAVEFGHAEGSRTLMLHQVSAENIDLKNSNSLKSNFELDGVPLELEGGFGSIERFISSGRLNIALDLARDQDRYKAKGQIKENGEIVLDLNIAGSDLAELSPLVGAELPSLRDYALKGKLLRTTSKLTLNPLELRVGVNDVSGRLAMELSPLSINAKLNSKALDLQTLLPENEASAPGKNDTSNAATPEPRIPFELLSLLDAELDLTVSKLTTFLGLKSTDTHLVASIKDGVLTLSQFDADLLGGELSGSAKFAKQKISAKLKGSHFEANPIMELTGGDKVVQGVFDFAADVTAKGSTLSQIVSTLNGTMEVTSPKAEIKSASLKAISSGLLEAFAPVLGSNDGAKVDCAISRYSLADGVATSKEQVVKIGSLNLFVEGKMDFAKNSMDMSVNSSSENPSIASLIPPFRLAGSITSPGFYPTLSGTVATVLDSTEGVARGAVGAVGGVVSAVSGSETAQLTGVALCEETFKREQALLSSRAGALFDGDSSHSTEKQELTQ